MTLPLSAEGEPTVSSSVLSQPRIVTAAVLVIGNEILSGRTKDANLNYLATGLTDVGQKLETDEILTVERQSFPALLEMIKNGEIEDAKTIVGIMLASNSGLF